MDAVRLIARAEVRRRRGSLVTIAVLVALVVGVVFATAAGARRTASVLERFEAATNTPSGLVGVFWPPLAGDRAAVDEIRQRLRAVGGVEDVAVALVVTGDPGGELELDFGIITGPDGAYTEIRRPLVRAGRMPAPDAGDEIAIPERLADAMGLGVGDRLDVKTVAPATADALVEEGGPFALDGPELQLEIVGVVRDLDDLRPDSSSAGPVAYASPAFTDADDPAVFAAYFLIEGEPERIDADELLGVVFDAAPDGAEVFGGIGSDSDSLGPTYRTLALGLVVFAAMAAVTGLLAVWVAVARHLQQAHGEVGVVMAALGMSRRHVALGFAAPVAAFAAAGVLAGVALSLLASMLFPISIARRAEPNPGVRFDAAVVVVGVVVTAAVVGALLTATSWRRSRPDGVPASTGERRRPSTWSRIRGALGAPAAIGTSLVIERQRASGVPFPVAAIAGGVIAVAGVVGVATFGASQHSAVAESSRSGFDWSAQPDVYLDSLEEPIDEFVARLGDDERLDAVGVAVCSLDPSTGLEASVCALRVVAGAMAPVITEGRLPSSPGEIALGSLSARHLGVGIGDELTIGDDLDFTMVGTAVMPTVGDIERPGLGAIVSEAGLSRVTGNPELYDSGQPRLVLRFADGLDPDETAAALSADHPALDFSFYSWPEPPELVLQLGRLRGLLFALAAFLSVVAAVGALHYLVLSVRRRRTQTGVLQALGFVRRQVRAVISWQAVTVAACAVLVGTPLGLVVGRWVWVALVDELGMVDTPVTPWLVLVLAPVAFVAGAVVLAAFPAWRSSRVSPSTALRGE